MSVGHRYQFVNDIIATITSVDAVPAAGQPFWQYTGTVTDPLGAVTEGVPLLLSSTAETLQNFNQMYRRTPKPAIGTTTAPGDGSQWIYPADGTGLYECYLAGTNAAQGDIRAVSDLAGVTGVEQIADHTWDWVPVTDGDLISVDDVVLYSKSRPYVLTGIVMDPPFQTDPPGPTIYQFQTGDPPTTQVTLTWPKPWHGITGFRSAIYQVTVVNPTAGSLWTGSDGSRWIYPGDVTGSFYCWYSGTIYQHRAVYLLGDMTITITPDP